MTPHTEELVGREQELSTILATLAETREGRGGLVLLEGDAGLGKSRLCQEAADHASASGLDVGWGRCWEAGGAPAFWPFVQALRGLLGRSQRDLQDTLPDWMGVHAELLRQLLPELPQGPKGLPDRRSVPAEQARFLLLDALAAALLGAAARRPLLLVLEDLHVADGESLAALDVLASQVRSAPLMVLGSYRDAGPRPTARALSALSHRARTLTLGPLDEGAVAQYLRSLAVEEPGAAPSAAPLHSRVHALSEGHPLYLVELGRLLRRRGQAALSAVGVAREGGLAQLLQQRLHVLDDTSRRVLEAFSIVGREASLSRALDLLDGEDASQAVRLALDTGLLEEAAPGTLRFSHVLIREVLYHGMDPARRQALHLRLVESESPNASPSHDGMTLAERAHHLRHAGPAARERAMQVTLEAARDEMRALAFDSAATGFAQALESLDGAAPDARASVLLELAGAEWRIGRSEQGRAHAEEAARLFATLDDAEGFARAALERGSILRFGHVDAALVTLLEQASERLGEGASPLHARVLARLAAASQPAPEPAHAIALARRAIEMARALGDPRLLLDVLLTGGSALVDLVDARERRPFNREHAELAEQLDDPVHALRAHTRLTFVYFELGDFDAANTSIADAERSAARLAHPLFAWVPVALSGAQACYEGARERARGCVEQLARLQPQNPDPNLPVALQLQRARLARLEGDQHGHEQLCAELGRAITREPQGDPIGRLYVMAESVYAAPTTLDCDFSLSDARTMLQYGDCTALLPLSQWAFCRHDRSLAAELTPRLAALGHTHSSMGVMSMIWDAPLDLARALAAATEGEHARADALFEAAFERAVSDGGEPAAARVALWWAQAFLRRQDPTPPPAPLTSALSRSASLRAEPLVLSRLHDIEARVSTARSSPPTSEPPFGAAPQLSLTHEGEHFRLRSGSLDTTLRDTKGVRWLATLLAEPGRPFHVLTLTAGGKDTTGIDAGDAGHALDAEAVSAYRARLRELDAELAEAEHAHDLGRLQRVHEEREMLFTQLSSAVGLGGRLKRDKSAVERARTNVQRRLKDAIGRIAELDPALGRYLTRSVRTGVLCVYEGG